MSTSPTPKDGSLSSGTPEKAILDRIANFKFEVFNPDKDNWKYYLQRFELEMSLLQLNVSTLSEYRRDLLLKAIGSKLYYIVADHFNPTSVTTIIYDELTSFLTSYNTKPINYINARYEFSQCLRDHNMSIADFLAKLHSLASDCKFGTSLDERVRDQFLIGLNNPLMFERISELHPSPSDKLTDIVNSALNIEAAQRQGAAFETSLPSNSSPASSPANQVNLVGTPEFNNTEIKNMLESINGNVQDKEKYEQLIKQLITLSFNGLEQDSKGFTPLMYAVKYNYREIMEKLLEYHKDIDISDTIFSKPLHIENNIADSIFDETKYKNSNLLKIINTHDQNNQSALNYAIKQENYDIACILILHGSSISNITTDQQKKLMLYAAGKTHASYWHGDNELRPVVGLLAIKVPQAVINYSDNYQYPRLLSYFCVHGHTKVVASLLDSIQDHNRKNNIINNEDNNATLINRIAGNAKNLTDQDYMNMIKYLLENGANRTANNGNAIDFVTIYACDNGYLETFKYLENKLDKKNFNTYIGLATRYNHMHIIEYIWSKYKKYTITNNGDTALHYAAWKGQLESIKWLCRHGADVRATNKMGETPLSNAKIFNTMDVQNYLQFQLQLALGD